MPGISITTSGEILTIDIKRIKVRGKNKRTGLYKKWLESSYITV